MSKPTVTSLQHLRKLIGYLKGTGELGMKLQCPTPGKGKWKTSAEKTWVLEMFCDADWMSNREHRRSTSCGLHSTLLEWMLLDGNIQDSEDSGTFLLRK